MDSASSVWFDQDIQGHEADPSLNSFPGTFINNGPNPFGIPSLTGGNLLRRQYNGGQEGYNHAVVFNVNGKWDGALFEHDTLVGTENNWFFQRGRFAVQGFSPFNPGNFAPLFLSIAPTQIWPFTTVLPPAAGGFDFPGLYQQRNSVYFQDLVSLTERLKVKYGARYDHIDQTYDRDVSGGGTFLMTAAVFNIQRQNVAIAPGDNPFVYSQVNQRSKGFEATLVGRITERLSTISNYSYTDVRQWDGDTVNNLNGRARGVPFKLANTRTHYNFIQERDRTFGAALGWVYVGECRGDYASQLRLDSYNRWDLGFFGSAGRFNSAAYIENIFNARYETGSISQYQIFPGAPVNFRIMAGITF